MSKDLIDCLYKKIRLANEQNQALRDELEAAKAELSSVVSGLHSEKDINKIKADAILSVIATPEDCETPTGDIAWSSESIQLIAEFQVEKGQ